MSAHVVVRCPSCTQKYRVTQSALGHRARCSRCGNTFRVGAQTGLDEDTILSWITDADPASESVMGSTGLFHPPETASAAPGGAGPRTPATPSSPSSHSGSSKPPAAPGRASAPAVEGRSAETHEQEGSTVRLARIDEEGAHFEFPIAALACEALRDAFPRKCVGCGNRHGLMVHLVYWPDRMRGQEAVNWKQYQNAELGEWDHYAHFQERSWLKRLPSPRHCLPPFDVPLPFLACRHCRAAHEVRGRVLARGTTEYCSLLIRSLATAVEFFRHNGGRHAPEYQRLIEERDLHHDRRNELNPDVRARLAHWFTPLPGEQFVRYFPDAEFSAGEWGNAGVVLTVRRLVFKKFAAFRDYPLQHPCKLQVTSQGARAVIQITEEGHRAAVLALDAADANQLVTALRSLSCRWSIEPNVAYRNAGEVRMEK